MRVFSTHIVVKKFKVSIASLFFNSHTFKVLNTYYKRKREKMKQRQYLIIVTIRKHKGQLVAYHMK